MGIASKDVTRAGLTRPLAAPASQVKGAAAAAKKNASKPPQLKIARQTRGPVHIKPVFSPGQPSTLKLGQDEQDQPLPVRPGNGWTAKKGLLAAAGKFATFAKRDRNKDGVLTGNEIEKGIAGFDKDGNKEITKDEFLAGRKKQLAELADKLRAKLFGERDRNKDGVLSGTETKKIAHWDKDKDGKVTMDEFKAGRAADGKARADKTAAQKFAKHDRNMDGVLTGSEITKAMKRYDKDRNGEITRDEFKAGLAEDRKKRREEAILGK